MVGFYSIIYGGREWTFRRQRIINAQYSHIGHPRKLRGEMAVRQW